MRADSKNIALFSVAGKPNRKKAREKQNHKGRQLYAGIVKMPAEVVPGQEALCLLKDGTQKKLPLKVLREI